MGFWKRILGEERSPAEPTARKDGDAGDAAPAGAEEPPSPEDERATRALVEHVTRAVEAIPRIEAAVQPLVAMLQATAKTGSRSDQDRKQQFLDLRAHITQENERLAEALRSRIVEEAAVEVFRGVVPAMDEIDHVLREKTIADGRGGDSIRLVRRKLRDALSRLGIEEIPIEEGVTDFDPELHEGKPHDGEGDDDAGGLAAGTIARLDRIGYMAGDRVLRCALVTVAKQG